jgi:hypothetical protein
MLQPLLDAGNLQPVANIVQFPLFYFDALTLKKGAASDFSSPCQL